MLEQSPCWSGQVEDERACLDPDGVVSRRSIPLPITWYWASGSACLQESMVCT